MRHNKRTTITTKDTDTRTKPGRNVTERTDTATTTTTTICDQQRQRKKCTEKTNFILIIIVKVGCYVLSNLVYNTINSRLWGFHERNEFWWYFSFLPECNDNISAPLFLCDALAFPMWLRWGRRYPFFVRIRGAIVVSRVIVCLWFFSMRLMKRYFVRCMKIVNYINTQSVACVCAVCTLFVHHIVTGCNSLDLYGMQLKRKFSLRYIYLYPYFQSHKALV